MAEFGVYQEAVVIVSILRIKIFLSNLFGIFVKVRNEKPPHLKVSGRYA